MASGNAYQTAFMEYWEKSQFIQRAIEQNLLPTRYLGMHYVDIMKDLIVRAYPEFEGL